MTTHSFIPVHKLLVERDASAWSDYWHRTSHADRDIYSHYPNFIADLIAVIRRDQLNRLFLIHKDRAFFLAGFLASLYAGVTVVLPPSDTPGLLRDLMKPGDGLLTDEPELLNLYSNYYLMRDYDATSQAPITFPALDPSKAFITFYTSGSTSSPKAIEKTLTQLEAEIAALEDKWGPNGEESTFFSTVPHHHIYGLLFSLLWPVCGGYPLHPHTLSYWEEFLPKVKGNDYLISSPSHLGRLPDLADRSTLKLKHIFSSGGALSFDAAQSVHQNLHTLPVEILGSTETGGIAYRQQLQEEQHWTRFGGVKLVPGNDQRLCLQSIYMSEKTLYQTEDLIQIVDPDHFHLLGRADRIVKVEGKRICLLEIEKRLLMISDFIQEVIVIPLGTSKRNELGTLAVLSDKGQQWMASIGKAQFIRELRANLKQYLDPIVIPRKWRFLKEIPTNAQGKRPYHLLLEFFKEKESQ